MYRSRYGVIAADPDGNVTFVLDRLDGMLDTTSSISENKRHLEMDTLKRKYAEYCTRTEYSNPAAVRACDSDQTAALFDKFDLSQPTGERMYA